MRSQLSTAAHIHLQEIDCRPARRSLSENLDTLKPKVFLPKLPPGVKQWHDFAGYDVNGTEVRSLQEIASVTRQSQVLGRVITAVLSCDDMFHMEREVDCRLRKLAILATRTRAIPDQLAERGIHHVTEKELVERAT